MFHRTQGFHGVPWHALGNTLRPPEPILLRATLLSSTGKIPNIMDEDTSRYWRQRSPLLLSRMQKAHDFARAPSTVPSHHICHHRGPSSAWWAAMRMWGWWGRLPHRPRGLTALFGLNSQVIPINPASHGVRKCKPALRARSARATGPPAGAPCLFSFLDTLVTQCLKSSNEARMSPQENGQSPHRGLLVIWNVL